MFVSGWSNAPSLITGKRAACGSVPVTVVSLTMHHGEFAFDDGGAAASNCPIVVPAPSRAANYHVAVSGVCARIKSTMEWRHSFATENLFPLYPIAVADCTKGPSVHVRSAAPSPAAFLSLRGPLSPLASSSLSARMRGYENVLSRSGLRRTISPRTRSQQLKKTFVWLVAAEIAAGSSPPITAGDTHWHARRADKMSTRE